MKRWAVKMAAVARKIVTRCRFHTRFVNVLLSSLEVFAKCEKLVCWKNLTLNFTCHLGGERSVHSIKLSMKRLRFLQETSFSTTMKVR